MFLSKDLSTIIHFANLPSKEPRLSGRYSHFQISFWTCFNKTCFFQCSVCHSWVNVWWLILRVELRFFRAWILISNKKFLSCTLARMGSVSCLQSLRTSLPWTHLEGARERERKWQKKTVSVVFSGDITDIRMQWDPAHAMMYGLALSWIYTYTVYIHYIITYVWLCIMQYLKIQRSCMTK